MSILLVLPMLQHFKHLYTDAIRSEAMRRFGFTAAPYRSIAGASHSFVYDCERGGKHYVLKVTHTSHRKPSEALGELEFINFLADSGVAAPRAVRSLSGSLVETIAATPGAEQFIAVAYEKAEGALVDWRTWTPQMFEQWGALIGSMHALTKSYEPSDASIRRRFWHQDTDWNTDAVVYRERPQFRDKARRTRDWLLTLPTDSDCFGLIHSDLHQWNFFYHDGRILPFDFDNTHYDWFISDFTTIIINVVCCQQHHYKRGEYDYWTAGKPMSASNFLDYFMTPFMEGYTQRNRLDAVWMRHLPAFLNRHWLTFLTDALRDPQFNMLDANAQAANFPWRTLAQLHGEVMNDFWSQFTFDKYA